MTPDRRPATVGAPSPDPISGAPDPEPVHLDLPGPLHEARFLERPNRFMLRCSLEDAGEVDVHMADPGRLTELLRPGKRVWIRPAASSTRKTAWSAVLVESPDGRSLVSVDTTLPNRLVRRALEAAALPELDGWTLERAEAPLGRSRIDFLLARGPQRLALEVKSVTLVEEGVARFPDAVTARGARHVRELTEVAGRPGWEAAILFVLQRPDAHRIEAARSIDPDFAAALDEARAAGVRILGRRCVVTRDRIQLGGPVPAAPG